MVAGGAFDGYSYNSDEHHYKNQIKWMNTQTEMLTHTYIHTEKH